MPEPVAKAAAAEFRSSAALRSVGAAGGLVATLLTTVVVVRFLEPLDTAAFLAILAGLMLGPMLGKLGLGQNLIRLVAHEQDVTRRRALVGAHLRVAILLSLLSAVPLAFMSTFAMLGAPDHAAVVLLTAALLIAETMRLMLSDVFAAVGNIRASVAATHHVRSVVVLPALGLLVVLVPRPTLVQMLGVYVAVAAVLLVAAAFWARSLVTLSGRVAGVGMLPTVVAGLAVFVLDASVFVVGRADVWVASAAFTPFDAARYGTVSMLAYQVTVLYGLASLAVMPAAARLWATGQRDAVLRLLSAAATLTTVLTGTIVLALVVLGRPLLRIAYGPEFASSSSLLAVLAVGGLGQAVLAFSVPLLLISGEIRRAVVACVAVITVVVPAIVAAGTWGGPMTLAAASAAAAIALPAAQWVTARRAGVGAPLPSLNVRGSLAALRRVDASQEHARETKSAGLPRRVEVAE